MISTEPAVEPQVVEVAQGETVAVITPKLVYSGDTGARWTRRMCRRRLQKPLLTLLCGSVVDQKGLVRSRSCTLAILDTPSLQPLEYSVVFGWTCKLACSSIVCSTGFNTSGVEDDNYPGFKPIPRPNYNSPRSGLRGA